jgi:hypothetical protein
MTKLRTGIILAVATAAVASGCYSPRDSQLYFSKAAADDPLLEQLHRTPLYTVYYDHAIGRCVLHSAHTWGESGGGAGGTGVGVSVFSCEPSRIKARREQLERMIEGGELPALPSPRQDAGRRGPISPGSASPAKQPPPAPRPASQPAPAQPVEPPPAPAGPAQPIIQ